MGLHLIPWTPNRIPIFLSLHFLASYTCYRAACTAQHELDRGPTAKALQSKQQERSSAASEPTLCKSTTTAPRRWQPSAREILSSRLGSLWQHRFCGRCSSISPGIAATSRTCKDTSKEARRVRVNGTNSASARVYREKACFTTSPAPQRRGRGSGRQ